MPWRINCVSGVALHGLSLPHHHSVDAAKGAATRIKSADHRFCFSLFSASAQHCAVQKRKAFSFLDDSGSIPDNCRSHP
ncbi:hypothetical protein KCP76_26325 (plasmid) [Salmonella enterica subsp. enterica serovar Weltevreden]|nr:hypothetical protein KCP76_26325 [Salmonella enterica subsp. enterica serovar Weltevreden]QUI99491.1 hypothetical protein KCP74_25745 [Salmonella enterica subsp. enterica]